MDERRIYLARHAQTRHNAAAATDSYADADTLSDHGRDQARRLGRLVARRGVNEIITSPLARARETAVAVNESLGVGIEEDGCLREIVPPSAAATAGEEEAEHWSKYMARHADDRDYSIAGAESFNGVMHRVEAAVERFDECAGSLVISHAGFLRFVMGFLTWGDDFSPLTLPRLWVFEVHNAGFCELRHVGERPGYAASEGWSIVTWMQRDHLDPP